MSITFLDAVEALQTELFPAGDPAHIRLHLDSNPTSPLPNLPRVSNNASASSTPRVSSPVKFGFGSGSAAPAKAETSEVDVVGERGNWDEVQSGIRAHRELSVIEEAASPAKAMTGRASDEASELEGDDSDRGAGVDGGRETDVVKTKDRGSGDSEGDGSHDGDDLDDRPADEDGPVNDDRTGSDHAASSPTA